jgi:hypothetical protein
MIHPYRPWGLLKWVLEKGPSASWNIFGCVGPEARSLGVVGHLRKLGINADAHFLRIESPQSRHSATIKARVTLRENEFATMWGNLGVIKDHFLLEPYAAIVEEAQKFSQKKDKNLDVILDVTSLPKRFFFPILKIFLQAKSIRNLLVTYTFPFAHAAGKLAENVLEWDHLPLFGGHYNHGKPEMVIVGVGFEAFGLQGEIDQGDSGVPVKLLLPFPCSVQSYKRSFEMIRRLQKHRSQDVFEIYRADSRDISDSFDRLLSLSHNGTKKVVLAPFGPKPISVAMCLFATLTNSPVYYTQPTAYNPDYSTGILTNDGTPEIYAYCVRLNGKDCFTI